MPQDWDIKSRSAACDACGREFEDKETYFSGLSRGEDGYAREDRCAGCWADTESGSDMFSVWQGTFRLPPPKLEDPVQKENAEDLLRRLIEDDDGRHANVIFILAVMLERKKLLSEKEVRLEDDSSLRVYEHRRSGETFIVRDPHLRLDRLEAVQEQVVQMLEGTQQPSEAAAAPTEGDPSPEETGSSQGPE